MLRTRHFHEEPFLDENFLTEEFLDGPLQTSAYTLSYEKGHRVPMHEHRRGLLIRPLTGSVRITVSCEVWLVSVGHALWMHPGTPHSMEVLSASLIQFVYVDRGREAVPLPANGRIDVPPLLNGILDELRVMPSVYDAVGPLDRLTSVMLDQITHAFNRGWFAECPDDRRLATIYRMMITNPSERRTLKQLARDAGAGAKTVERLLRSHCNMSFREWRDRITLGLALDRLREGGRVTEIALELGYASASAFICAFKRQTHMTPKQFANGFNPSAPPGRNVVASKVH